MIDYRAYRAIPHRQRRSHGRPDRADHM